MKTDDIPVNIDLTIEEQVSEMIYRWLHKDQITHVKLFWDIPTEQRKDYFDIAKACIKAINFKDNLNKPDLNSLD